ncbi:MAG: hypothetical protein P4L48_09760 [Mycobacterium sp.]|jgi:hypothetical protein|nr:hypothetical protein [Mycobacterium sp.]
MSADQPVIVNVEQLNGAVRDSSRRQAHLQPPQAAPWWKQFELRARLGDNKWDSQVRPHSHRRESGDISNTPTQQACRPAKHVDVVGKVGAVVGTVLPGLRRPSRQSDRLLAYGEFSADVGQGRGLSLRPEEEPAGGEPHGQVAAAQKSIDAAVRGRDLFG